MPAEETLLLIDGPAIIFRSFFALPPLANAAGVPTNALVGFYNTVNRLLEEEEPARVVVAMDLPTPTFRHEAFPEYKANRSATPVDLVEQFPLIRQLCEALRIPVLDRRGFEADDLLATLARRGAERGWPVVVVTADKDLFQVVTDRVVVLNPFKNRRFDPAAVESHFGVPPGQVADVLALWGDSSDNVPGVPGIGEKGAKELIRRFGSLAQSLRRASEVTRKAYREGLQQHADRAESSLALVTVRDDVPLDVDLDALRLQDPDHARLGALLDEFEIRPRPAHLPATKPE